MTHEKREQRIQRILVALDTSPASLTALEAAAELAASLGAELVGIFVEDINLLQLPGLAISYEVGFFSAARRPLDPRSIERQLRAQAKRARQALAVISERAKVNWSFRVARGVIASEILAAAMEADLITLGRVGWSPLGRRQVGSTVRTLVAQTPRLTLMLQPGSRLGLPILVIYDGSAAAQQALIATAELSRAREGSITVLILADQAEAAQRLQAEAAGQLERWGLTGRYVWRIGVDVQRLAQVVRIEGCRLLVLPSDGSLLNYDAVLALLSQVECPVLLVRP